MLTEKAATSQRWGDLVDSELPLPPPAVAATKKKKSPNQGWTEVVSSRRAKPAKKAVEPPLEICAESDKFAAEECVIFDILRQTFPKGLTAEQIAYALKKRGACMSGSDVGNYLYGDKPNIGVELAKYVKIIDVGQHPHVWRIRAKSDD